MNTNSMNPGKACDDMQGVLPSCAPLATPYVPFQQNSPKTYMAGKGMIRGTMYPGLDLPFMGMENIKEKNMTELQMLQALNFAISELGIYLDTHAKDTEAVTLFNQYVEQYAEQLRQYEQKHGSTTQMGSALTGKYDWLDEPWPWDYQANKEG